MAVELTALNKRLEKSIAQNSTKKEATGRQDEKVHTFS